MCLIKSISVVQCACVPNRPLYLQAIILPSSRVHLLCLVLISSLTWLKLMSAESSLWLMTLRSLISSSVLCWLVISFSPSISLHPTLLSFIFSFLPVLSRLLCSRLQCCCFCVWSIFIYRLIYFMSKLHFYLSYLEAALFLCSGIYIVFGGFFLLYTF